MAPSPHRLLEAVPNVSEGRDRALLRRLADELTDAGAYVADTHADPDHNRSVFSIFGTADVLHAALRRFARTAVDALHIHEHAGVHPRHGVIDVLPIVPLDDLIGAAEGGTMDDALALVHALAADLDGMGVPVLRYGHGTTYPHTGAVRTTDPATVAELHAAGMFGSPNAAPFPHPTAGVTMLGARNVLVAFNVELASTDLEFAKAVAAVVRERGGGLPGVRALGMRVASRHSVEVTTNIDRWHDCGPAEVLEKVLDIAASEGVGVTACELVGLAPREAMHDLGIASRRNRIRVRMTREPSIEVRARLARQRMPRS